MPKPSAWPEGTAVYLGIFAAALFAMLQVITILNCCHHFRGFVYQYARFASDHKASKFAVGPRKGSVAICSRCHQPAPGYDQFAERRCEFIPLRGAWFFCCTRCAA